MIGTDAGAARRNLVLLSLAFILYTFGDGSIGTPSDVGGNVSLLGGSFHVKSIAIAISAWVLYFWFMYRYWQELNHYHSWREFIEGCGSSKFPIYFFNNITIGSSRVGRVNIGARNNLDLPPPNFLSEWYLTSSGSTAAVTIKWYELWIKVPIVIEAVIFKKHFAIYYLPILLWVIAGISAAWFH
jgi:hypothetical protein